MQAEPSANESRTSRFRGLSYDKKWQGWRVRLYWKKKQRHVGRYTDEITAAKAYDKAAVYLYGIAAVTNFGLQACLADPTEVSPHISKAKEEVGREEQRQLQQRMQHLKQQQSCSPIQPVTPNHTERCTVQRYYPIMQQVQSTGMQQLYNIPAGATLIYAPSAAAAAAPVPTSSTSSYSAIIMQQQQVGAGAVQVNKPVLLHDPEHAACAPLTIPAVACTFGQQQQSCLPMCLPSLAQPMQLSVEPQLVTIAEHISAAPRISHAPADHDQADQLLCMLSLQNCSNFAASTSGPWVTTAAAAPAAMPAAAPVASVGQPLMAYSSSYSSISSGGCPADVATPAITRMPYAAQSSTSLLQSPDVMLAMPGAAAVPTTQFEQRLQLQETMSVGSNSSSCSPMAAATAAQLLDPVTRALFFGCY